MSGPSPIVKTRLKATMHARFLAEQQARGVSESELLRLALIQFFESAGSTSSPAALLTDINTAAIAERPEQSFLERKTVWMPAFLMREASTRATAKGMSFSRWISSLVQSNVLRCPVLADTELRALEASTRELAAIGRNINQIARALHEAYFQTERIRLDKLAELSENIAKTRLAIATMVRASRRSWRV